MSDPLLPANRSPTWSLWLLAFWTVAAALWFVSPWFPRQPLAQLQTASGGWASITLLASLLIGGVQVLIVVTAGRQRLVDIGWRRGKLVPAALATLALWTVMQLSTVIHALLAGQALEPRPAWAAGLGLALGPLLAQLVGTALMEETVFRGYLWPQMALRFTRRLPPGAALGIGLLVSQVAFALLHIPVRLHDGAAPAELASMVAMLFFTGLVFALVYAATRNLFVAVGAHALGNTPTLLFVPQGPEPTMVLLAGVLLLSLVWWQLRRKQGPPVPRAPLDAAAPISPVN